MRELKMMGGGQAVDSDRLTATAAHVRDGDIFFGSGSDEEQVGKLPDRARDSGVTIGGKPLHAPDGHIVAEDSDGQVKVALVPPVGDYPGGSGAYVGVTPDVLGITEEHIANNHSVCGVAGNYGADGNATPQDLRAGLTAYNKDGKFNGELIDYGNVSKTLACGESYNIEKGIYGSGKVTAKDLASQTAPDSGFFAATAAQILNKFMAVVNGKKVQGGMADNTGINTNGTVPGISAAYKDVPTREAQSLQLQTDTKGTKRINMCPPAGYYQGGGGSYVNRPASDFGAAAQSEVLKNRTFTSTAGINLPGTMKNITADASITHSGSNATKVVPGDAAYQSRNSDGVERVQIRYNSTSGYITGNTIFAVPLSIMANALGIIASKIVKGHTICGVAGNRELRFTTKIDAQAGVLIGYNDYGPYESSFVMPESGYVVYGGIAICNRTGSNRYVRCEVYKNGVLVDNRNIDGSNNYTARTTMINKSMYANKGDVIKVLAQTGTYSSQFSEVWAMGVYF